MATATEPPVAAKAKGRILIVDDELVVRDSLGKWFTSEGYAAARQAARARRSKRSRRRSSTLPCWISRMPGMDGMELQARLHEADPELTVVMMTGTRPWIRRCRR